MVWVYLLTTIGSSASPSPALDKEKLFYFLACRGALSCHGVGVFSLYPSWHAPNGSSLNLASFGWSVIPAGHTFQKSLGRSRKIGLFPSPHHQTIPPYLWPMTPSHPILAGYRNGNGSSSGRVFTYPDSTREPRPAARTRPSRAPGASSSSPPLGPNLKALNLDPIKKTKKKIKFQASHQKLQNYKL